MKILLLDNSSLTPIEGDYCVDIKTGNFAKELQDLGNEVTIYGQKVVAPDTTHSYKLKENKIKVVGLKRKKNKILNYLLLYIRILPELIKSDFIYIFYPTAYKYVPFLCWCFRKKYGLYIRGMQGVNDKISHWNYKKAYIVFTVSDYFTSQVNKIANKELAYTIRPMIPFTDKDVVTDRVYTIKQKINILFLGRLDRDKGIAELLQAVKALKEKEYDFELNLVGDGGFMPEVKKTINDLKIENAVNIIGAVYDSDAIKKYYIQADIFVLPSYHEGFPRTLYEAMIFGTPIITTFVGGISTLMKNKVNCIEIKPKSVNSIIEQLDYAIKHYDTMIRLAENGTNTVLKIVDSKKLTHAQHLNKYI